MDPAQPPAGDGRLRLTIQNPLVGRAAFGVRARVDGEPVRVEHGENVIALAAGRHRVEAFTVFVAEHGNAVTEVDVPSGGEASLWYAPPFYRFVAGRIGHEPQQPAGTWFLVMVAVALFVGPLISLIR